MHADDDMLASHNAESILTHEIGKYFELDEDSIGLPKIYLGIYS